MPTSAFPDAPDSFTGYPSTPSGMLPYHFFEVHGFGSVFDARLLSTHSRSTSELLRTL